MVYSLDVPRVIKMNSVFALSVLVPSVEENPMLTPALLIHTYIRIPAHSQENCEKIEKRIRHLEA